MRSVFASLLAIGVALGAGACSGEPTTGWEATQLQVPNGYESNAQAISDQGVVVGSIAAGMNGPSHPGVWRNGLWVKLPELGESNVVTRGYTTANAVNSAGLVVGGSTDTAGFVRAVIWEDEKLREIGGEESVAQGINDRGQIVVDCCRGGYPHEADFPAVSHPAFVWQSGTTRSLGTLVPTAINARGQVIGIDDVQGDRSHAFLWDNGRMRDLGTLGGDESIPLAINDRGQIVGSSDTDAKDANGYPIEHAFLWTKGKLTDLGTLGGASSSAVAINERGQIVGVSSTTARDADGFGIQHAFLWENGKMRDLGTLGGTQSRANAINGRGQIVGSSDTDAKDADGYPIEHAFVWANGKITDLPTTVGDRSMAEAINELGQIIGMQVRGNGLPHAFLWMMSS